MKAKQDLEVPKRKLREFNFILELDDELEGVKNTTPWSEEEKKALVTKMMSAIHKEDELKVRKKSRKRGTMS